MNRILKSLAVIVAVAAVAGGATWSYFSDEETVAGNTFSASTLDLTLDQSGTLPFNISNLKPGDNGTGSVTLTNVGNMAGNLSINLVNKIDEENGLLQPETNPPYGTADYEGNGGELDFFLGFAAFVDVNKDGSFNAGDIQITYNGQKQAFPGFWGGDFHYHGLGSMMSPWNNVMQLDSNESVNLVVMWQMPTESQDGNYSQNIAMSDKLGFDVNFSLEQAH